MKVRLKPKDEERPLMKLPSFNSMKVRLKQSLGFTSVEDAEFQFHEGPIKTGNGNFDFECREQFQFHEGPIKTMHLHPTNVLTVMFQFHEGPIKTLPTSRKCTYNLCFNSMKVRLKPIAFFSKIPLYTRGIIIQRYKNSSRKYVDVE